MKVLNMYMYLLLNTRILRCTSVVYGKTSRSSLYSDLGTLNRVTLDYLCEKFYEIMSEQQKHSTL